MMTSKKTSMSAVATEVARALVRVSSNGETVRFALPLLYPGGSMVPVELSRLRDSFLVSDAGNARREASLLGGERSFLRLAQDVAARFSVRFDQNMFFDIEVPESELVIAVMAVANASKTAVESTAMQLAAVEHADYQATLWDRLEHVFGSRKVEKKFKAQGSTESWEFDAAVKLDSGLSLFEIVTPHHISVGSAVTKFLDIKELGRNAPHRIAILTNADKTPHIPVLARTAKWIRAEASDDSYKRAA